jgi:hypothetical protein
MAATMATTTTTRADMTAAIERSVFGRAEAELSERMACSFLVSRLGPSDSWGSGSYEAVLSAAAMSASTRSALIAMAAAEPAPAAVMT